MGDTHQQRIAVVMSLQRHASAAYSIGDVIATGGIGMDDTHQQRTAVLTSLQV